MISSAMPTPRKTILAQAHQPLNVPHTLAAATATLEVVPLDLLHLNERLGR